MTQGDFIDLIIEGSLEVKLPTIWTDEKQSIKSEEKVKEEKLIETQKTGDAGPRKGRKVAKHRVLFCGSGGSKSRLARAAGVEPAGQMRDEKLARMREAHFEVKLVKAHQARTTFGSGDVEKAHAVVARSTIPSQNGTRSDHSWMSRCQPSACRCGAKHIWKLRVKN